MAYYYIKTGGTATGDAGRSAIARTGSFASMGVANYYNSVYDVFAGGVPTTPPNGDNIITSNLHNETVTATLEIKNTTAYYCHVFLSVNDSNVEEYAFGAKLTHSSRMTLGTNSNYVNSATFLGFDITCLGLTLANRESVTTFKSCAIDTSNDQEFNNTASSVTRFIDSTVNSKMLSGGTIEVSGGSIALHYWTAGLNSEVYARGCDFSASTTTKVHFSRSGRSSFYSCKFPADWMTLPQYGAVPESAVFHLEAVGCDVGSKYYNHIIHNHESLITTSDSVGLNYPQEGAYLSYLIASYTHVSKGLPARLKLCEIPAQNLSATDTTYRVQLLLDTDTYATLTDSEFFVEVSHNDNTDLALGVLVSSRNADILSNSTELTSSVESWQGTLPTNTKAYQIDITLSAASLTNVTNGNVVIYVNLAVANTDVYVCPAVQIGT